MWRQRWHHLLAFLSFTLDTQQSPPLSLFHASLVRWRRRSVPRWRRRTWRERAVNWDWKARSRVRPMRSWLSVVSKAFFFLKVVSSDNETREEWRKVTPDLTRTFSLYPYKCDFSLMRTGFSPGMWPQIPCFLTSSLNRRVYVILRCVGYVTVSECCGCLASSKKKKNILIDQ